MVWEQNFEWLFYHFNFEKNYDVLKSKTPCILLNKNINFNKNETESRMKNPTHSFKRRTLCFSSYKNRKLKVKLWWVGARKRKKRAFLYRLFCPKKFFLHLCFISMCSVLNTLPEYTYFSILLPFLHINIIENLQCILFLFHVGCS